MRVRSLSLVTIAMLLAGLFPAGVGGVRAASPTLIDPDPNNYTVAVQGGGLLPQHGICGLNLDPEHTLFCGGGYPYPGQYIAYPTQYATYPSKVTYTAYPGYPSKVTYTAYPGYPAQYTAYPGYPAQYAAYPSQYGYPTKYGTPAPLPDSTVACTTIPAASSLRAGIQLSCTSINSFFTTTANDGTVSISGGATLVGSATVSGNTISFTVDLNSGPTASIAVTYVADTSGTTQIHAAATHYLDTINGSAAGITTSTGTFSISSESITISTLSAMSVWISSDTLGAQTVTVSSNSGVAVPITLSGCSTSSASSVTSATVASGGSLTVYGLAAGTCSVTGTLRNASNTANIATTTVNAAVNLRSTPALSVPTVDQTLLTVGTSINLAISPSVTLPTTPALSYAVKTAGSTTGLCSLSGSTLTGTLGVISGNTIGTCVVTVTQAANAAYPATTLDITTTFTLLDQPLAGATLTQSPTGSILSPSTYTVSYAGTTYGTLSWTIGGPCTGSSTTASVTVTIVTSGTCTATLNAAGTTTYRPAVSATLSTSVTARSNTISFTPSISASASTATLSATASSGLPVTFSSADTAVCTISGSTLTVVADGICDIDANQVGGSGWDPAPQVTASVTFAAASGSISGLTTPTNPGYTTTSVFAPVLAPAAGRTVTLTSRTTGVCTVASFTVTYVSDGSCTLTASAPAVTLTGVRYAPVSATLTYTVAATPRTITGLTTPTNPGYTTTSVFTLALSPNAGAAITLASGTTAVCTVSASTVTYVADGSCTLTASSAASTVSTTRYAAASATISFTVAATPRTITGLTTPASAGLTTTSVFTLAASPTGGAAVTLASSTTGVCTVSASTVTYVTGAVGTCTLTASSAASTVSSTRYAATSATLSYTVDINAQVISIPAPTNPGYTTTSVLAPVTSPTGGTVTLTSATTSVCTVATLTVTYLAEGTCTINATTPARNVTTTRYSADTETISYIVAYTPRAITGLTIPTNPGYTTTSVFSLAVSVANAKDAAIVLASSTTGVCTVASYTVTYVADGTCTLTASITTTADSTTRYAAASATISFTVAATPRTITGLTAPASAGLTTTSVFTLAASPTGGAAVTLASSTTGVCTVSASTVTYVADGSCTLTASSAASTVSTTRYAAATATITFTVAATPRTITGLTTPTNPGYTTTSTFTLSATGGAAVTLTSSTTGVCTVSGSTVTYVADGSCTLTASSAASTVSTTRYTAASDTITFTVAATPRTISLSLPAGLSPASAPFSANASATPSAGPAISYTSNDTDICTVNSGSGLVTIKISGVCSITASSAAGSVSTTRYAAATATDTSSIALAVQVAPTLTLSASAPYVIAAPLSASVSGGSAKGTLGWTISGACSGTNSSISLNTAGVCSISATYPGDAAYASVTVSREITVAASQTISFTAPVSPGYVGTEATLSASASSGLTVTFSTTSLSVCSISGNTVSYLAEGSCTISANQAGNGSTIGAATSVSRTVTVLPSVQLISASGDASWTANTGVLGSTATLTATASSGLPVSAASTTTGVCTISTGGSPWTVTFVGLGDCSVRFTRASGTSAGAFYLAAADLILTSGVTSIPAPAVNSPNSLFNFSASNVPGANSRVQMTNPTIVGIGGAYSSPDGTLNIAFGCGAQSNRPLLDAIEFTRILTIDGVAQASVSGTQSCTAKGSYTLSGLSSGSYQISARAVVGSTKSAAVSVGSVIVGAAPVVKIAPIAGSVIGTGLRYLKTTTPTLYWSLVTGEMTGQTLIRYSATPTAEGACPAGAAPGSATAGAGWSPDISFASGTTPATLAASSRDKGFANAALPERCVQFAHVGANGLFSATAWSEIYLVDVTKPSLTPTIAGTLEGAAQTCSTVTVQSCRIEPGVATVSVSASDPAASGVPGSGVMNIRLRGDGFDSGLRPYNNTANRTRSFTAPSDKSSMTLYATITDRAGNSISIPVSFSVASAVDPVFNAVVDLVDCADTSVVIRPDFAEQGFLYWPVGAELCLVPRVDMAVKGLRYVNGVAQESVFIGTLSSKLSGSAASANDTELAQIGKWPTDKIGQTFTLGEKPTTLSEARSKYGSGDSLYEKIAAGTATDTEKALYRSAVLRFRIDAETSIDNADSVPYISVPFSFTYVYGWVARGSTTPLLDYVAPEPVSITLRIIAVNLGAGQ